MRPNAGVGAEGVALTGFVFVCLCARVLIPADLGQRENNWTAWKKAKCPDFNAREPEKKNEGDEDDGAIQVGDKRKEIRSVSCFPFPSLLFLSL